MEHLTNWRRDGQILRVKTKTSEWLGKLANNETRFDEALELEQEDCRVVVIPWHAVEYVRALDAHTDG